MGSNVVPEGYHDLLLEKRTFAHLATKNEDGSLQSTPVWVDWDGQHVLVNTARGRRKYHNMIERPQVALSIHDPDDPYRYLEIRGRVVEHTEEGAWDHIHKMARKYLDEEKYPYAEEDEETRVLFSIAPQATSTHEN